MDDLLARQPDVVVEVAGHQAVRMYAQRILSTGCDLIITSTGAMGEPALESLLAQTARASGSSLDIASGAIGALDALAAAAQGGLTRVIYVARKPAATLLPADEVERMTAPKEIFRGTAREGVKLFPKSINVAASVSLAGLGFDRTEVRVIADPKIRRNEHAVRAVGHFGSFYFRIRGLATDMNPRTARLAAMSVAYALRRRNAHMKIVI